MGIELSEEQLRNFEVKSILTNGRLDEKPIITSPADIILTQIVFTELNAEFPFESNLKTMKLTTLSKRRKL